MKRSQYQDSAGRWFAVWLPDDVDDSEALRGIVIGPPPLDNLGLPEDVEIRLSNELFWRGLLTAKDVKKQRMDLLGALLAALKVDADNIVSAYIQFEKG